MREIEFRGWNKEKKEMWYQDNPYHSSLIVSTIGKEFGNLEDVDVELMQYTGLKDKNGTKIFEGDIVYDEYSDRNGIIQYSEEDAQFKLIIDNEVYNFSDNYGKDYEVIRK